MTDYEELKRLDIEKLLIRAIGQGNGASRQEIMNRQLAHKPVLGLGTFLYKELNKLHGSGTLIQTEAAKGPDLDDIDLSDDPDAICTMARRFMRDGFLGQNMRDPQDASLYIRMAADNPRVMDELPEKGVAFWKSAEFHYRKWKLQNQEKAE